MLPVLNSSDGWLLSAGSEQALQSQTEGDRIFSSKVGPQLEGSSASSRVPYGVPDFGHLESVRL